MQTMHNLPEVQEVGSKAARNESSLISVSGLEATKVEAGGPSTTLLIGELADQPRRLIAPATPVYNCY